MGEAPFGDVRHQIISEDLFCHLVAQFPNFSAKMLNLPAAVCLANRAAALLKGGRHQEALTDAEVHRVSYIR